MRLLQITTLISAVLVNAAYVYIAPNLPLGSPDNYQGITNNIQQQQAYISQSNRGEDKSISYSTTYKDYGYLRTGNVPNYLANIHQFTPNHNNYNIYGNLASGGNNAGVGTNGNQANNGYRQYTQSWNPKHNLNNIFSSLLGAPNAQNNIDQTWKPVNNVQKTTNGYSQSSSLFYKNNNQNIGHGQANQYSYPISHSYSNVHIPHADNNVNYNTGLSNILIPTAQNGVHNNGLITSKIKHNAPLNNAINEIALTTFNNNQNQSGRLGAPLNNGYTQGIQSKALNSAYSQSPQTFATDVKHNSIYTTSTSGSANNNLAQNNIEQNQIRNRVNSLLAVTPIIHKHVYFHVPPPDIDEPQKFAPTPALPKKDYKILFIKVPSQTSTLNLARLQQQMAQTAALQEKTLIYVLVKKPAEPNPLLLSPTKQSQHQVFFVKYNGDPFNIASQVNNEIDETGSINSIVPLAPGLVNGQS